MSSAIVTLLTTIDELVKEDNFIIRRIKEYKIRVKLISYVIAQSKNDGTLTVKEVETTKSASQVINEFRFT